MNFYALHILTHKLGFYYIFLASVQQRPARTGHALAGWLCAQCCGFPVVPKMNACCRQWLHALSGSVSFLSRAVQSTQHPGALIQRLIHFVHAEEEEQRYPSPRGPLSDDRPLRKPNSPRKIECAPCVSYTPQLCNPRTCDGRSVERAHARDAGGTSSCLKGCSVSSG